MLFCPVITFTKNKCFFNHVHFLNNTDDGNGFPAVLERGTPPWRHKEVGKEKKWGRSLSEDGVLSLSARSLRSYLYNLNVFQRPLCGLRSHTVCSHPCLHGQVGSLCFCVLLAVEKQTWMLLLCAISIRRTRVRSDTVHSFLISSPKQKLCFSPMKEALFVGLVFSSKQCLWCTHSKE